MEGDEQVSFVTKLAERGLSVHSFDGHTFRLTYNAAADQEIGEGRAISGDELTQYAQRVLADAPEENRIFPGVEGIEIEFGEI